MNTAVILKRFLLERGIRETADGISAWQAFKSFGRSYFAQDGVGLLFQVGVHSFSGSPRFYFDPVCQFQINDDDGEFHHFEQTHCELTCDVTDELQSVHRELWSFDFASADEFFEAVEVFPEFQIAVQQLPYTVNVFHEAV